MPGPFSDRLALWLQSRASLNSTARSRAPVDPNAQTLERLEGILDRSKRSVNDRMEKVSLQAACRCGSDLMGRF